jgi:hypothetical protein
VGNAIAFRRVAEIVHALQPTEKYAVPAILFTIRFPMFVTR